MKKILTIVAVAALTLCVSTKAHAAENASIKTNLDAVYLAATTGEGSYDSNVTNAQLSLIGLTAEEDQTLKLGATALEESAEFHEFKSLSGEASNDKVAEAILQHKLAKRFAK